VKYRHVLFDCDSTLSAVEGIDELARRAGVGEEVAALTARAMAGEVPLEAVYGQRLELIRPTREDLDWLAARYLERITPGAEETVAALVGDGVAVHLISGGLRPALVPLAAQLAIPGQNLHAAGIEFDADGNYLDFEQDSPLAHSGGKTSICRTVVPAGEEAVMIGDGVTDLETLQAGIDFIGFGGVVVREAVKRQAPAYVEESSLLALLPLLG